MESSDPDYIHGTHPEEQKRLSRLNALLNASSLQAMPLRADDKILDVGSGLGQFSRLLARKAGSRGSVVAVEGDPRQLAEAHRQAVEDGDHEILRPTPEPPSGISGPDVPTGGGSMLEFLMNASADLSSSLKLNKVFHKIARRLRPVIDYHLFCVQLWNEETQLLEHSFSMKYGEEIPQKGGFPLGYGLCGSCAVSRRPIRVANVQEDPRYVRFRHPEVEIRSELAVPLLFKDQLIGVLDLESTEFDSFTEEQEQMVSALASHIAAALVNARLFERVQRHEQRMERDLSMARELGGDFYDFLDYGGGRMALAVGDVAGKSIPAALLAAMLADLNEYLRAFGQPNRFVAMAFAVYDEESRTLKIANTGLPRILLASANGTDEIPLVGLPLGLFHDIQNEEKTLKARDGDAVVFCSDGLLECENPDGEAFGVGRLRDLLGELRSRAAQEIADELNRATVRFAGDGSRRHDDHTVVVLKFV